MSDRDPVIDPHVVAARLGCHYETVLRHIRAKRLKARKQGGKYYIRESAYAAFVDPPDESEVA